MDKPRVGVLMPVYNLERFVNRSVHSILSQTYTDFDLWIIDDGSTDNTYAELCKINDSRIKLIQNSANKGFVNTLNAALDEMDYEFLARMDGDDFALPSRFEKQVQLMDSNPDIVLCGTQATWIKINENGETIERSYWRYPIGDSAIRASLVWNTSFVHSSVLIRNSMLGDLRYDTDFDVACEDWDLWTRLSKNGMVYNLDEPLMECTVRENSLHRHNMTKTRNLYFAKISANLKNLDLDQETISVLTAEYGNSNQEISFHSFYSAYLRLIDKIEDINVRKELARFCGLKLLGQIRDYDFGKFKALSVFFGPLSPGVSGFHKIKGYMLK